MTAVGARNKYMTVSVWSNDWSVPALEQVEDADTSVLSGKLIIEFKSSEWAKYEENWTMPTAPASPGTLSTPDSNSPASAAYFVGRSIMSLGIAYQFI